ncbi:unnamed protein product [Rotaria magnacalcarata]|nr:unnamed protein product [Rotaria magnacalcarata]CAF1634889.1 unnamed protein product [Rotaria magnacalcarata]CAF3832815.1 unnamed protein product [Rotaria magnacalcarata]CAF3847717.1 unnamed protein product [Rotaria magnacalcarata]CAF3894167.1 unnamed protein product [Rotaria magnacalcarata]
MIIITSDEDLVRQFSLKRNEKTYIIDLDNEKQMTSLTNNNNINNDNMINLAFLAELSELNSSSDQVYKQVLNSSDHQRSRPVKIPKKSIDLVCTICGDRAIGFNYDALSCASCKAFFRRNAHQTLEKLRCLIGQGQCSVTPDMHRKCQRCRLERCFAVGMRKDFILSEQDKERRRKRIKENRNMLPKRSSTLESIDSLSSTNILPKTESASQTLDEIDRFVMDMDKDDDNIALHGNIDLNETEETSSKTLSCDDWIAIQSIRSSFLSFFQNESIQCSSIDVSSRTTALISWSQFANKIALSFISFLRQLDEFEGLDDDDRFMLVKYNLLPVFPIFKCFNYKPINHPSRDEENKTQETFGRFFMLCGESPHIGNIFMNLVISLVEVTQQDPTLLSLLSAILIFSQGLSLNENEPPLKDSLAVNRAQMHYTNLLWNYWFNKWGETQTYKFFTQLLAVIFRIQSAAKIIREFFRFQFMTSNTVDLIGPLVQSVLLIA